MRLFLGLHAQDNIDNRNAVGDRPTGRSEGQRAGEHEQRKQLSHLVLPFSRDPFLAHSVVQDGADGGLAPEKRGRVPRARR